MILELVDERVERLRFTRWHEVPAARNEVMSSYMWSMVEDLEGWRIWREEAQT